MILINKNARPSSFMTAWLQCCKRKYIPVSADKSATCFVNFFLLFVHSFEALLLVYRSGICHPLIRIKFSGRLLWQDLLTCKIINHIPQTPTSLLARNIHLTVALALNIFHFKYLLVIEITTSSEQFPLALTVIPSWDTSTCFPQFLVFFFTILHILYLPALHSLHHAKWIRIIIQIYHHSIHSTALSYSRTAEKHIHPRHAL